MRRILLVLCSLFLLLGTGILLTSAQPTHPTNFAQCGATFGCPPTPVGSGGKPNPGDPDGDGIPNGIDQCPNDGGPSSNQGCPVGRNFSAGSLQPVLVTPSILNILLPILPTDKAVCAMATLTDKPVNVRAQPSIHAQIIGTLDPHKIYYPDSALILTDGSKWIALIQPYGWVSANVVRLSPGCPYTLATYKQRPVTDPNPLPLSYVNAPPIVLDKSGGSGEDTPQGYCAPSFGVDVGFNPFSKGSDSGFEYGGLRGIQIAFGDGSVQPNPVQGCFKLDVDGHGFGIEPPPDPDAQPFSIHFSIGFSPDNPNELALIGLLLPVSKPGEPPPDPDKTSMTFTWNLVPPGPCKSSDPSCAGKPQNFMVDFSQPGAANPGVAFSWNIIPPGPCKSGDQSCTGDGSGKQGVLINLLPAVQNVAVNFFPNGFDPSIGGFTQIENQPGGSSPGDKYGFTQIENQPLTGRIAIDFTLPAVP